MKLRAVILSALCLLPACKGYDSTVSVSIEDRLGRITAGITIRPDPNSNK